MNWTLLAVIAILGLNVFIGLKRGLIKMVYSLVIMVVVMVITSIFAPKLATYLKNNTTWDDALNKKTESFLLDKGVISEEKKLDINELPIPNLIKDKIANLDSADFEGTYNEFIVNSVSNVIFSAIVYLVFFLILLALASVIGMLLDIVSKLPVLKQVNKLAGMAVGLVQGLLIVWLLAILVMVFGNFEFAATIHKQIDANGFLTFLYDKNLIMYFVTKILF